MVRWLSKFFTTYWPFGLLAFFILLALSFTNIEPEAIAQIFGLAVICCAALAWLVSDSISASENRIHAKLKELEDVLKSYEGMKLKEMPPEVQALVRAKLGWTEPAAESKKPDKNNS